MSTWILPACVDENKPYYYEVDRAFDTLKTIFWAQNRSMKSIAVGDIAYIYESSPVRVIAWKCRVVAVNVPYDETKSIDESEFEHGDGGIAEAYVKLTAICKYDDEGRQKLSYAAMRDNGLKSRMQGPFRPNEQLLAYINSVEPEAYHETITGNLK